MKLLRNPIAEMQGQPISIADAAVAGITRRELRGPEWRRVARGHYVRAALPQQLEHVLVALHRQMPPGHVFSGPTAAWLHGVELGKEQLTRIEVTLPNRVTTIRSRPDLRVRWSKFDADDVVDACLPVTTPRRTCFDLARHLPLADAVAAVDAALHARLSSLEAFRADLGRRAGWKGVRRARRVAELAEPKSESPMESRLRLLLVLNGLPKPQAQASVYDADGNFAGRVDLYYPDARLGIEYDGGQHRDSLVSDDRRQNGLYLAGVTLLRYTASDVYRRPAAIVAQVRAALAKVS